MKIAELYKINNQRVKHPPRSDMFLEHDSRLREAIHDMGKEINVEIKADEDEVHEARLKAMISMKNHWEGLIIFVGNPEIPMDNNKMENGIRPCALGRNNYIGNHSLWAGNCPPVCIRSFKHVNRIISIHELTCSITLRSV